MKKNKTNLQSMLIVDWLDKYGGAERVLTSICTIFNISICYVLVNIMKKDDLEKVFLKKPVKIIQTPMQFFGKRFRMFFFLFPWFMRKIKIDPNVKVIISSSHAIAKGVRKSRIDQVHISYFQARNQKYIWDDYKLYFGKLAFLGKPILKVLRKMDYNDAQKPDYIIANSIFVKNWVLKNYNRTSDVIYPPVDLTKFQLEEIKEDYYVAVGRLEPYKRFDLVVKSFNKIGKKLIVVGDGTELNKLKKIAKSNIKFTGFLTSDKVFEYIKLAKGFVHAGIEDFGIAPIEAQACGTPVIAFGYGGVLETVIQNKTGIFFYTQKEESLIEAIEKFELLDFNYHEIRKNAERFSKENFERELKKYIEEKVKSHNC